MREIIDFIWEHKGHFLGVALVITVLGGFWLGAFTIYDKYFDWPKEHHSIVNREIGTVVATNFLGTFESCEVRVVQHEPEFVASSYCFNSPPGDGAAAILCEHGLFVVDGAAYAFDLNKGHRVTITYRDILKTYDENSLPVFFGHELLSIELQDTN